ncbi:MAG: hypothetical protein HDR74_05375 [Bacteroides sp.]|nr:hypothetical protein [Bacteroides sp.]
MESIYFLLGLIAITCFLIRVVSKKEREENWAEYEARLNANETTSDSSSIDENKNESFNKPDTLGLMFNSLQQFGCQPTVKSKGSLSVQYQGVNFQIDFIGMYARVWELMWASIKADDPDLPKIREAVNTANFNSLPTVVITTPDEDGYIGLHSRCYLMLHPANPDNAHYVEGVLLTFFSVKEEVRENFQQIKTQ